MAIGVLLLAITDTALAGRPWFERINEQATSVFYFKGNHAFKVIMMLLTLLGTDAALFSIALGAAAWLWRSAKHTNAMTLLAGALLARILVLIVKIIAGSARPRIKEPPWPLIESSDFGYPSGHAIVSIVILGLTAFFIFRYRSSLKDTMLAIILWSVILGIGVSRIYLGYHWVNDVLGGYLYGSVILLGASSYKETG